MKNSPEYIIGGTKVEVGQVWENADRCVIVITEIQNHDIYPIMSNKETYTSTGKVLHHRDKCVGDLIKCVGRVAPLEEAVERDKYHEMLCDLYFAARGLCYGVDWNNGTHAKHHRKTLEDCVKKLNGFNNFSQHPEMNAKDQQPDAEGWIVWHGGECPVDSDTRVETKRRDNVGTWTHFSGKLNWKHNNNDMDIIAYRMMQQTQSELEQPKKLKLSAGEMVRLVKDSHHYLCGVGEYDIGSATYGVANLLAAIEANPELMEYLV